MSPERLEMLKKMWDDVLSERKRLNIELAKLNELIGLYGDDTKAVEQSGIPMPNTPILVKPQTHSLSSPGIMQKAIALTLEMYDSDPRFISTGEVLAALEKQGLTVGGKSPSGNVSSYLKHTTELTNFRGFGWVRTRDKDRWLRHVQAA